MSTTPSQYEALIQAVEIAGGQSAFARICGVTQGGVWKWLQSSKRLPAEYVLRVEAATGISRHLLRPDIYPRDLQPAPAAVPTSAIADPTPLCGPILSQASQSRACNRTTPFHTGEAA